MQIETEKKVDNTDKIIILEGSLNHTFKKIYSKNGQIFSFANDNKKTVYLCIKSAKKENLYNIVFNNILKKTHNFDILYEVKNSDVLDMAGMNYLKIPLSKFSNKEELKFSGIDIEQLINSALLQTLKIDNISKEYAANNSTNIIRSSHEFLQNMRNFKLLGQLGESLQSVKDVLYNPFIKNRYDEFLKDLENFSYLLELLINFNENIHNKYADFFLDSKKIVENMIVTNRNKKTYAIKSSSKFCMAYDIRYAFSLATVKLFDLVFLAKMLTSSSSTILLIVSQLHGKSLLDCMNQSYFCLKDFST